MRSFKVHNKYFILLFCIISFIEESLIDRKKQLSFLAIINKLYQSTIMPNEIAKFIKIKHLFQNE
jgi:hypothetical protein